MGGNSARGWRTFGPSKSIRAGENLFAWGSVLLPIFSVPFVRQADAPNPVSRTCDGFGFQISPKWAVSKTEPG
jgi:hypothetical protein